MLLMARPMSTITAAVAMNQPFVALSKPSPGSRKLAAAYAQLVIVKTIVHQ